jgi:hypothetical protein
MIFLVYGFKRLNLSENGLNEGGDFMILGREACDGAWESLSWKPRM